DYRFEAHTIVGNVPGHYDGMQLQNLTVKTLWLFAPTSQGGLGMTFDPSMLQQMTPNQFAGFVGQQLQQNYGQYQFFSNNFSFGARLSMYKVFGDGTGVQVFNGQPNSLNIDGTTAGVPNSDQVRVEHVFFNWNNIGGSKLYLSIGRRPAVGGPPLNFRDDEPRGGTPSGGLFDFQYDGMTV